MLIFLKSGILFKFLSLKPSISLNFSSCFSWSPSKPQNIGNKSLLFINLNSVVWRAFTSKAKLCRALEAIKWKPYLKVPVVPSSAAPDSEVQHQTWGFMSCCYQFSVVFAKPWANGRHSQKCRQITDTLWTKHWDYCSPGIAGLLIIFCFNIKHRVLQSREKQLWNANQPFQLHDWGFLISAFCISLLL